MGIAIHSTGNRQGYNDHSETITVPSDDGVLLGTVFVTNQNGKTPTITYNGTAFSYLWTADMGYSSRTLTFAHLYLPDAGSHTWSWAWNGSPPNALAWWILTGVKPNSHTVTIDDPNGGTFGQPKSWTETPAQDEIYIVARGKHTENQDVVNAGTLLNRCAGGWTGFGPTVVGAYQMGDGTLKTITLTDSKPNSTCAYVTAEIIYQPLAVGLQSVWMGMNF